MFFREDNGIPDSTFVRSAGNEKRTFGIPFEDESSVLKVQPSIFHLIIVTVNAAVLHNMTGPSKRMSAPGLFGDFHGFEERKTLTGKQQADTAVKPVKREILEVKLIRYLLFAVFRSRKAFTHFFSCNSCQNPEG